jgi:PII-like signaling protein
MKARRVRIYVGERDKAPDGRPLYEAILHEAHRRGLAGASVFKGVAGFGANSRLHTAKILRLSEDLPLVIDIVDEAAKIDDLLPWLDTEIREGLVTVEEVTVLIYRSSPED